MAAKLGSRLARAVEKITSGVPQMRAGLEWAGQAHQICDRAHMLLGHADIHNGLANANVLCLVMVESRYAKTG